MATLLQTRAGSEQSTARAHPLAADRYERILAYVAIALLIAVAAALARGVGEWGRVPAIV